MKTQTQIDLRPRSKDQALRELDEQFDSAENRQSGKLPVDQYFKHRQEIENWPDIQPPVKKAAPIQRALDPLAKPVTRGDLQATVTALGRATREKLSVPMIERIEKQESASAELQAAVVAMTDAISSMDKRLSATEASGAAEALAKAAASLVSAERRLSRHGEHLARIENRLKAGGL